MESFLPNVAPMEAEIEEIKRRMLAQMLRSPRAGSTACPYNPEAGAAELAESLRGCKVVVADFWAEWCGPCRITSPIVEAVARKYEGRVAVLKINVDEHPELAAKFEVLSIPTIIVFHQGREVERFVGYSPSLPRQLDSLVKELLS
ncbi:MAG: thioredoxin [Thermofilum sp.]